jgi:hypothetical protein
MASSRFLSKLVSDCLKTSRPVSTFFPRFLINLLAWVYGSIMSGHLLDLNMMIPFSTDNLSDGSPATPQAPIVTGSPRTADIVTLLVYAISYSVKEFLQITSRSSLYFEVNDPEYEMATAATSESPTTKVSF